MAAPFLTGILVGLLIGLAIAPLLRSWVLWHMLRTWREGDEGAYREAKLKHSFDEEPFRRR